MSRGAQRLTARLERLSWLDEVEAQALAGCTWKDRRLSPREHLVRELTPADGIFVMVTGFACRYRISPSGRRQIIGLLVPGDVCGLRMFIRQRADHSVCALNEACASVLSPGSAASLLQRHPRLGLALWWLTVTDDSITREWVLNLGYRNAFERVAHLLCEIFWRLENAGLARDGVCEMPMTQIELGDALALSAVHVNRTLMDMRKTGLIRLQRGRLELLERRMLEQAAAFDTGYLESGGSRSPVAGAGEPAARLRA